MMRIAIGSDHAGFEYKGQIIKLLGDLGHEVQDFGTDSTEPVDYPLFIRPVALAIVRLWLTTPFEGGRHLKRLQMIDAV